MNAQVKENETRNAKGGSERRVDTMEHRSSAGQGQEERNVQVVHQTHPTQASKTSGGVLSSAAAAVATTLQSAKDALSKK
ncbi:hypothetical protein L6164_027855 [Bauhinia variegata]|uniref:Uncharacterized protein n=1 Tax=Bauhinia variegata TaxID=167791 RepID=A0ACB9LUD6_BAUVA|nr:hypothetical protein L6164_027855 [Bauhinia variegata]